MNIRIAAFCAALATAAVAVADTVDLRFVSTGSGQNVRIHHNGTSQNVFAGQLLHEFTNGTGIGAGLSGQLYTFCTEVTEFVTSSSKTYDILSPKHVPTPAMGPDRANALRDIYAFAAGQQNALGADNAFAAAFQIAVWEIVLDYDSSLGRSSLDVATGDFMATRTNGSELSSAVMGHLNDLFDAIGNMGHASTSILYGLRNNGSQDQLIQIPTIIPLPIPAAMAGIGLLGVAARRRRSLA